MDLPILQLPRTVPLPRERQPQANIPQTRRERDELRRYLREFIAVKNPVPPLSIAEMRRLAEEFIAERGLDPIYVDYTGVLLNNEVWRESLARVPYNRRLLLLPKCMRIEDQCPAPFDEFGLLCKQCGLCTIQELQEEAERLGYAVLVAEGSALVMAIIETGKIEAIVGVSCLSVLEKAFPFMEAAAIPGIAIPLLQDDCKDVTVDEDWVWDVVRLTSDDHTHRLNLDVLRDDVKTWFTPEALSELMGPSDNEVDRVARGWLAKDGKRWRPFLSVCAWKALCGDQQAEAPTALKKLAIAVECFHKASLVHDDIEDEDEQRYGEPTLPAEEGVAIALNAGDLLIGDGYALIGDPSIPDKYRSAMLRVAADGHRTLCLGQGAELAWARHPRPLTAMQVLDIFRQKTAPAFEVALQLGALLAGADDKTRSVISQFSQSLGIAYQIRDDVEDMDGGLAPDDLAAMRPTLPLALLYERVRPDPVRRALVEDAWHRRCSVQQLEEIEQLFDEYSIRHRCQTLQESYKEEAIRCLETLESASLKGLLRRVISKIFTIEVKDWCSEFEARNAAGRSTRTEDARGVDAARH